MLIQVWVILICIWQPCTSRKSMHVATCDNNRTESPVKLDHFTSKMVLKRSVSFLNRKTVFALWQQDIDYVHTTPNILGWKTKKNQ